eukprot:SM000146S00940  [mRNA]  locus=s146:6786:14369:- [translate_table: standard]
MAGRFQKAARKVLQEQHGLRAIQGGETPLLELSVPVLSTPIEPTEDGPVKHQQIKSRKYLISSSGHFTISNNEETSSRHPKRGKSRSTLTETIREARVHVSLEDLLPENVTGVLNHLNRQPEKVKRIKATKDVLASYHDSVLYGSTPPTLKVRSAIRQGWLGVILIMMEFVGGLVSVIFYVISTYRKQEDAGIRHWLAAISAFFFIDYALKLYSAQVRLHYVFSLPGIIDLLSTVPLFFYATGTGRNGAIFRILLIFRVLRPIKSFQRWGIIDSTITQQVLTLVIYILGILFITAGTLQWVEYKATPNSVKESLSCNSVYGCISFYEAFYLTIVTISTVGYGDITPKSSWGRFVIICTILATIAILPLQINRILEIVSRRPYGGTFSAQKVVGSRYIIISGNLTFETIQDFLFEFYHPRHSKDLSAYPLHVVILAPYKPSFDLKSLVAQYNGLVEFKEGDALNYVDLKRVSAISASAFFLLSDQRNLDPSIADSAQFVRALAVHRHCGAQVRVIVEVLKPESENNAIWDDTQHGVEVICMGVLRFKLLASACSVKGMTTFVTNLFKSTLPLDRVTEGHWMSGYYKGSQNKVFPSLLPEGLHHHLFEEVAEFVYTEYGVALFALDMPVADDDVDDTIVQRKVVLFPAGHVITPGDVGLVIAPSLAAASRVSRFCEAGSRKGQACRSTMRRCYCSLCSGWKREHLEKDHLDVIQSWWTRAAGDKGPESVTPVLPKDTEAETLSTRGSAKSDLRSLLSPEEEEAVAAATAPSGPQHVSSLEEAVDRLLAWPPPTAYGLPHPEVLRRRSAEILAHLATSTLVVYRNDIHILVCIQGCWPMNIYHLVANLRGSTVRHVPVVILYPQQPTASEWGVVGVFPAVYFINGSPLYELDLMRAGVLQAEKVLILTEDIKKSAGEQDMSSGDATVATYSADVDNIVIAANVERLRGKDTEPALVELQHPSSFQYLRPKWTLQRHRATPAMLRRSTDALYAFCPPYLEGKAFCPTSLQFFSFASFYNRHVATIVDLLVTGGPLVKGKSTGPLAVGNPGAAGESAVPRLKQVPVPRDCVDQPYKHLFLQLLHHHQLLALGLYRAQGSQDSLTAFVHTNPGADTLVGAFDLVFAIG